MVMMNIQFHITNHFYRPRPYILFCLECEPLQLFEYWYHISRFHVLQYNCTLGWPFSKICPFSWILNTLVFFSNALSLPSPNYSHTYLNTCWLYHKAKSDPAIFWEKLPINLIEWDSSSEDFSIFEIDPLVPFNEDLTISRRVENYHIWAIS